MTRKQNYFKIVGSKDFIRAALKVIDEKFQVVFQTDIRESDSARPKEKGARAERKTASRNAGNLGSTTR